MMNGEGFWQKFHINHGIAYLREYTLLTNGKENIIPRQDLKKKKHTHKTVPNVYMQWC